jgi:HlyD family secretion protein
MSGQVRFSQSIGRGVGLGIMFVCAAGSLWGWGPVSEALSSWSEGLPVLATVAVDRGDVAQVVIECGTVESPDDDVIRCQVESFLSLPVAASGGIRESRASTVVRPRPLATGISSATGAPTGGVIAPAFGARSRSKLPGAGAGGSPASKPTVATVPKVADLVPKLDTADGEAPSDPATAEAPKAVLRPEIRSFEHPVEPHVPLRATATGQEAIRITPPPPPVILSIVPEGTKVRAGDLVCELDSAAFRQALDVQKLRHVQAKAWVEQARFLLEASEIALREYRDGILPQDVELTRHYIALCESERDRVLRNLAWARGAFAKGFRTEANVEADLAKVQLAEITLHDAEVMSRRLVRFTAQKNLKAHRAKTEAIHADLLSLESTLRLESERLARIESMISNCTMLAPRGGVVVHAHRVNAWGGMEAQIREGLTIHQSQPIYRLLDPGRMYVKARINESQVGPVKRGQSVSIRLDAFPDRALEGSVDEVMPIPSLARGPFSDVRVFFATVRIVSGGFDELRAGLTAKLEFHIEAHHRVPRVPLEAIRWRGDRTFAGRVKKTGAGAQWSWEAVELGLSDSSFAEVVSGLVPGDRVIAHAEDLTPVSDQPDPAGTMMELALEDR